MKNYSINRFVDWSIVKRTLAGQPSEYPPSEASSEGGAMWGATQPKAAGMTMGLALGAREAGNLI